jgi:predicted AAA+ superfamily ATPase
MIIIQSMKQPAYRPRALAVNVEAALRAHPVVVVSGGRQTGKTTLVQHLPSASGRTLLTLDDLDVRDLARRRPEDLLARGSRLTLDEVQRVPELLLAIKRDVDQHRQRGRFLLTGSANLLLTRQVADSLAGRAVYLLLSPFTAGEKAAQGTVPPWSDILRCRSAREAVDLVNARSLPALDWRKEALIGGMPPAVLARSGRDRDLWFDGFIRSYVERDLRDVAQVADLPDFRRLMGLASHRIGQLLNQTEVGRDAGLAQATTHRYLNLLDTTFQIHRLPAFAASPSKRLIKAPKLYWTDVGVAAHLCGVSTVRALRSSRLTGALLENLVLSSLLAWRETVRLRPGVFYWRTAGGAEIDFVIEQAGRVLPIEVKAAARVASSDLRHIEIFLDDYTRQAPFAVVLHDTDTAAVLTRRTAAVPVRHFL